MKKIKVAYISSVHQPDDVRIYHKQLRTLASAGFDVLLVAKKVDRRVNLTVPHILIEMPKSRLARIFLGGFRIMWVAHRAKADVIHFHDPELIPFAIVMKFLGKKVIYDVHEDVQKDILDKHYIPKILRRGIGLTVRCIELIGASLFYRIVAATPAIGRRFPSFKVTLLQNFPFKEELRAPINATREVGKFIYAGGISAERSFPELLSAFEVVSKSAQVSLVIAGPFSSNAIQGLCLAHPFWSSITYKGVLSRGEMAAELGNSQVGVVIFQPVANNIESQPNKLFEYMSAGLPVIASNFALWQEIVLMTECGLVVDPTSAHDIAAGIKWFIENPTIAAEMGRKGRLAVEQIYNWENESTKLIELYQSIY